MEQNERVVMKRFHFRLETLLRLADLHEQKQLAALSPFLIKSNGLTSDLQVAEGNYKKLIEANAQGFSKVISDYIVKLRMYIQSIHEEKVELDNQMEPIRQELMNAKKKKKGLEILKENQFKKWNREITKSDWQNKEDVFLAKNFRENKLKESV